MSFMRVLKEALNDLVLPQDIILTETMQNRIKDVILELNFKKIVLDALNFKGDQITPADVAQIIRGRLEEEDFAGGDEAEIRSEVERLISDQGVMGSLSDIIRKHGKKLIYKQQNY